MVFLWIQIQLLAVMLVFRSVALRTKASHWTPQGDCVGEVLSEEEKQQCLVTLIEEVNLDPTFKTFGEARTELLRRVNLVIAFGDDLEKAEAYKQKEDSVFLYVKEHSENLRNKLETYSKQFEQQHKKDHKTFTEEWLLNQTGEEIQLEGVMEYAAFEDFVGVYDIKPQSAYIASKMIIDQNDFMGTYSFGSTADDVKSGGTYEGVAIPEDLNVELLSDEEHTDKLMATMKETIAIREQAKESLNTSSSSAVALPAKQPKSACGCSDAREHLETPHALGEGEYIQFRVRNENVRRYIDNSKTSQELMKLVPDTPEEPVYIFTVSTNGVMRFHPWGNMKRKLWHAFGDSETSLGFPKNIWHAGTFGCFCFGIIYKERENYETKSGVRVRGGRTIIMRYNRWATDNAPIYAMVRQRVEETNTDIPEQPGGMFTGIDPSNLEDLFQKLKDVKYLNEWMGITDESGNVLVKARRLHARGYEDENPILALGRNDYLTSESTYIKNRNHIGHGRVFTLTYADVFSRLLKDVPGLEAIKEVYLKNFANAVIHGRADSVSVCDRVVARAECWSGFAKIHCTDGDFWGNPGTIRLSCTGVGIGEPCLMRASLMSVEKPRSNALGTMCEEGKCRCEKGNAPAIERCSCQHAAWWNAAVPP